MNLKPIKANMNEVEAGNLKVLFSYKTPVAYLDKLHNAYFRTSKKWSQTTTRHINTWLNGVKAAELEQEVFDGLLNEVK